MRRAILLALLALAGCKQDPPRVTSFSPNSGPVAGGTNISITGVRFEPETRVFIGGLPATKVTFGSETSITATTPPGQLGLADLSVKNDDDQRDGLKKVFLYTAQAVNPAVTSLAPTSGAEGTAVTISGSGFQTGATVRFGTNTAASIQVTPPATIACVAPAGSGTVDVVVQNPDGGAGTLAQAFTYPGGSTGGGGGGASRTITTFAGTGTPGSSGDGGQATAAQVSLPSGVAVGPDAAVFVVETQGHRVRRIDPSGVISTFAGTGTPGMAGDGGPAAQAQLSSPEGIAVDAQGSVYIADTGNHAIRRITAGNITTIVGTLGQSGNTGDGAAATMARLLGPRGLAVDAARNVIVADTGNHRVRRVDAATSTIQAFAGTGLEGFSGDTAAATSATLRSPAGVAIDSSGAVFIADTGNDRVRRVDAMNVITTFAGGGPVGVPGDGGPATMASLVGPVGLAFDPSNALVIAEASGHRVRLVAAGNLTISTLAGTGIQGFSGDGGNPAMAGLNGPRGVATNTAGAYFIADANNARVRRVQ